MSSNFDKRIERWFKEHPYAETTVMTCDRCGLSYKPSLGHDCPKLSKQKVLKIKTDNGWVKDGIPTRRQNENGIVGIVNGKDGNTIFEDALIFISYDFKEKEWVSDDYCMENIEVKCWFPLPELPKSQIEE